jgi:hypothetical protein
VRRRVWWAPTDDKERSDFGGMFWTATVTKKTKTGFKVVYDNGAPRLLPRLCAAAHQPAAGGTGVDAGCAADAARRRGRLGGCGGCLPRAAGRLWPGARAAAGRAPGSRAHAAPAPALAAKAQAQSKHASFPFFFPTPERDLLLGKRMGTRARVSVHVFINYRFSCSFVYLNRPPCTTQAGEFCEVSNASKTDPAEWLGVVARAEKAGKYLVRRRHTPTTRGAGPSTEASACVVAGGLRACSAGAPLTRAAPPHRRVQGLGGGCAV